MRLSDTRLAISTQTVCRYLIISGSLHRYSFLSSCSYFNLLKVTIPYGFRTSSLLQTYRKLSSIAYLKVSRLNSSSFSQYSEITSCYSRLRNNLLSSVFPKDSHSKSSISAVPSFTKVVRNYVNLLTSNFQL